MTEAGWLVNDDAEAMLRFLIVPPVPPSYVGDTSDFAPPWMPSDRKLRLFASVCMLGEVNNPGTHSVLLSSHGEARAAEEVADGCPHPREWWSWVLNRSAREAAANAAMCYNDNRRNKADALRCIVGNPHRPLVREKAYLTDARTHAIVSAAAHVLWQQKAQRDRQGDEFHRGTVDAMVVRERHVTPTVVMLAEAAYRDRNTDGTLDPVLLAAVADALEEAGLPTEQKCDCANLGFGLPAGQVVKVSKSDMLNDRIGTVFERPATVAKGARVYLCKRCNGKGQIPHPLLSHLRSPEPHYRGCHAIDLILGKA